jgi:hypothetical protein
MLINYLSEQDDGCITRDLELYSQIHSLPNPRRLESHNPQCCSPIGLTRFSISYLYSLVYFAVYE